MPEKTDELQAPELHARDGEYSLVLDKPANVLAIACSWRLVACPPKNLFIVETCVLEFNNKS